VHYRCPRLPQAANLGIAGPEGAGGTQEELMSSYDTGYVRAESAYKADRIRESIAVRREKARLRRSRPRRRGISIEVL